MDLVSTGEQRANVRGKVVVLIVLMAACAAAYWIRPGPSQVSVTNEGLVVADHNLQFGEVWENGVFEWKITIENPTQNDVAIDSIATSCSCLSLEPTTLVIHAGRHADVQLKINAALAPQQKNESAAAKDIEVMIVPHIRDALPQQSGWIVRGHIRTLLNLEPATIRFDDLIEGQQHRTATAVVRPAIKLQSLNAVCPADRATVEVSQEKGGDGIYKVKVTPRQTLSPGTFRFEVTLMPVGSEKTRLPDVRLPVECIILPEVQSLPQAWLVGANPVGEVVTETVVLTSLTGKAFEVSDVDVVSNELSVEPMAKTSPLGKAFRLTLRVSKLGEQKRTVTFSIRMQDGKVAKVPLCVNYVGLSPRR
jgi:hypothetical protein